MEAALDAIRNIAIVLFGGLFLSLCSAIVPLTAHADPDCRCVYAGHYYLAGEVACIRTPAGPRLARCGKVSNLSSWRFSGETCSPVAARVPRSLLAQIAAFGR